MKKGIFLILLLTFSYADLSLGGITLNVSFSDVADKYPFNQKWDSLEAVTLPYPISLVDKEPYYIMESPRLDIQVYFNINKRVEAITATLYEKEDFTTYETYRGLRLGDSKVEIDLLYGDPIDVSRIDFTKQEDGENNIVRIYYFNDLCLYTREFEGLPEIVTNITVGKFDQKKIARLKEFPINYEKLYDKLFKLR